MKFQYKMTQRPFGIGCQPKGAVDCINSNRGLTGYHSIAVYDFPLTEEQIKSFELTPVELTPVELTPVELTQVETFANYIEAPKN
jgi:hypothetical protein